MNTILIDSSIIIDFLRLKDKTKTILVRLERGKFKLCASIITHTECFAGKSIWEKKEAMETLKILLSSIKILPLEENISRKAGQISAKYNTDLLDAIIAATALTHKLDLATLNIKDFEKIKGLNLR